MCLVKIWLIFEFFIYILNYFWHILKIIIFSFKLIFKRMK